MGRWMPKYAARSDSNQSDIVKALRDGGAKVWPIRRPVDLLIGIDGSLVLAENKAKRYVKQESVQGGSRRRGRPLSSGPLSGGITIPRDQRDELRSIQETGTPFVFLLSEEDAKAFVSSKRKRAEMIADGARKLREFVDAFDRDEASK